MGQNRLKETLTESKWILVTFAVLFAISLPCCCFLGYRTQWILWTLGLR